MPGPAAAGDGRRVGVSAFPRPARCGWSFLVWGSLVLFFKGHKQAPDKCYDRALVGGVSPGGVFERKQDVQQSFQSLRGIGCFEDTMFEPLIS